MVKICEHPNTRRGNLWSIRAVYHVVELHYSRNYRTRLERHACVARGGERSIGRLLAAPREHFVPLMPSAASRRGALRADAVRRRTETTHSSQTRCHTSAGHGGDACGSAGHFCFRDRLDRRPLTIVQAGTKDQAGETKHGRIRETAKSARKTEHHAHFGRSGADGAHCRSDEP